MKNLAVFAALGLAACGPVQYDNSAQLAANLEAEADRLENMANAAGAGESRNNPTVSENWSYREEKDEMRGSTSRWASVDATKDITLDFPYGSSRPSLTVRFMKQYGTDVMLSLNGQITCRSYNQDTVSVKFDDGSIKAWRCLSSDDGDSSTAFISPAKPFIAALKRAKTVTIEAPIYQAGKQQMTFEVAGLNWD